MVVVKIPPPRAREVARACRAAADELVTIQNDVEKSLGALRQGWRGDAEAEYASAFEDRVVRLNDRQLLLRSIGYALVDIAQAGERADRDAKAVAPR